MSSFLVDLHDVQDAIQRNDRNRIAVFSRLHQPQNALFLKIDSIRLHGQIALFAIGENHSVGRHDRFSF